MDNDQSKPKPNANFDAALPLPEEGQSINSSHKADSADLDDANKTSNSKDQSLAADIIRKKVQAAYGHEPALDEELSEAEAAKHRSKHQDFVYNLTSSAKPLAEMQSEWHEYYSGLSDTQKHQVWQEFYTSQAHGSHHATNFSGFSAAKEAKLEVKHTHEGKAATPLEVKLGKLKKHVKTHVKHRFPKTQSYRPPKRFQSLIFGLAAGFVAVLIVMFGFFNERFIAPFIQPSRNATNTPLISGEVVGPNPEIIIPKINIEIPVVYGVTSIDESVIGSALEGGALHYADTAQPGQNGNVVLVGHSSNNIFNNGKYKFAFVLLNRLENGDTFFLQKDGKRYTYQVYQKTIVKPTDVSVLGAKDKAATATLITCDPPGTNVNRLVVVGEQISPDPAANAPQSTDNALATQTKVVPGNAKSLWARIWSWL